MRTLTNENQSKERTLLSSLLLSAPGPLVTGIPAFTSLSATQLADFIRRTAELVALGLSWWIFRRVHLQPDMTDSEAFRLEQISHRVVGLAMLSSGLAMGIIGLVRLTSPSVSGNVLAGLIIAGLGLGTNGFYWWRYGQLNRLNPSIVIAAQQRLYRAKTWVDGVVMLSLLIVTLMPTHPLTPYIDAIGCLFVGGYLLYSAYRQLQKK